ncbi:MAG: hypothetical protein ABSG08_15360 [Terriglobales bacterium]|jgi:hypothetical protein
MSTDWDDWARDEYELEMANRAVEEFQIDRLQSYYKAHSDLAEKSIGKLDEARALLPVSPNAALVLAMTSLEVGFKSIVVRPIMTGLVHNESLSEFVTEVFVKGAKPDGVLEMVSRVLKEYASIDLQNVIVGSHKKSYWEEMTQWQKVRNAVLHRAETCSKEDAGRVIELADYLWVVLFPKLLKSIGLHTHDNKQVCEHDHSYCESIEMLKKLELARLQPKKGK